MMDLALTTDSLQLAKSEHRHLVKCRIGRVPYCHIASNGKYLRQAFDFVVVVIVMVVVVIAIAVVGSQRSLMSKPDRPDGRSR